MRLYNTLNRQVEEIIPLNPPKVTVYTCGPTVYDYPHVGNWFTFIRYDLLIRSLKTAGQQPVWVMNITDVGHLVSDADEGEDKLEKGARRESKTAWDIAKFYGDYFIEGLSKLNFSQPDYLPKATEHIEEQIELVKQLDAKGYTYQIDDGIYYDTDKFRSYADFANLDLDEQQAGARVEYNSQKRNPTDFALWKFSPADHQRDMEWDSPWGKGFPGWHLECSAMVRKYLGDTIDIHSGGIDHIAVHHTNEIAQSQAVTGRPLAQIWMHTNHILINDEKISKSLGNGVTLEDIEAAGYSLEAFRLHVLESHYRSQSKFSWDSLDAAQNRLKSYQAMAVLRYQTVGDSDDKSIDYDQLTQDDILKPLQDDLNTPQVLANLSNHEAELANQLLCQKQLHGFTHYLQTVDNAIGLTLSQQADITDEQKDMIKKREEARKLQNWQESDDIRNHLTELGIGLRDTERGAIWFRL